MFDKNRLHRILPAAGLGVPFFHYRVIGSTNDAAINLANQGGPHGALVLAEEQTTGRGQKGRSWHTARGCGLALSLILRPSNFGGEDWMKYHAVGALAVVDALGEDGIEAWIKWPNDVLAGQKKVAGILIDVAWEGDQAQFVVLGIGINVNRDPGLSNMKFDFPAGSIEDLLHRQIDGHDLLVRILSRIAHWLARIHQKAFLEAWERKLSYRGENVVVKTNQGEWVGKLAGLNEKGALRIEGDQGVHVVQYGDVQIRRI